MVYHIPWIYTPVRSILAIWHQFTKTEIPELAKCSVLMKERSRVEETIYAMQRAGAGSLHVISDFDMTLTRFAHNGKRVPTTHNILDNRLLINEDCTKKMRQLLNTYYPIEIDASRTAEEKLPLMGVLRAFKGQLIHTFNKREGALSHAARLTELQGRPNVLLLGDSLGDLTMADGVSEPENILTIGFLNDQVEERKETYVNSFDIVLVKDETMDVPNSILRYITSSRDNK
eukprot:superscaffoldBa00004672_g19276